MLARATALAAALLLLPFAPLAVAPANGNGSGPACLPGEAFENDDVRLWFQGLKGHVIVEDKREGATYAYASERITELGADGEELRYLHVGHAFPHDSTCQVEERGEHVLLSITITDDVRDAQGGATGDLATVELQYAFNTTGLGAKFDLVVVSWPWAEGAAEHRLAYDLQVTSGDLEMSPADDGVGMRNRTGDRVGYVQWAHNATATYPDGTQREANVTSHTEGSAHALDVRLTFEDVAGGYERLLLDPWVGLGDWIIVAGRLIGLGEAEGALPEPLRGIVRAAV